MPTERNDSLWKDSAEPPPAHSVLRTRAFWRTLFRLDVDEQGYPTDPIVWNSERHVFDLYVDGFSLTVESGPDESRLCIASHEAARLDETVTMPHFFRWREIEAISNYFERERDAPNDPSVVALLLSPFLAVTDDELNRVQLALGAQLRLLGLLDSKEIESIIANRFVPEAHWVPDEHFAWRLVVVDHSTSDPLHDPIHSERVGEGACAPFLMKLLRMVDAVNMGTE